MNSPIEVAALGDSFTHGACVHPDKAFVFLIRNSYPTTLNLGIRGMGPLSELAAVEEYLTTLKPKVTVWFYFEGNDISEDLGAERDNPIVKRYLSGNFSQDLITRQPEIDHELVAFVDKEEAEAVLRRRAAESQALQQYANRSLNHKVGGVETTPGGSFMAMTGLRKNRRISSWIPIVVGSVPHSLVRRQEHCRGLARDPLFRLSPAMGAFMRTLKQPQKIGNRCSDLSRISTSVSSMFHQAF